MHKKYLALAAFAVSAATAARKKVLDAEDVPAVCATLCQFALDQTRACDDENRSKDDFLLCVCGAPDAQLLLVQCSTCISTGVASPAAGVSDGASPPVVSLERRRETKRNLARSRVYRSTRVGKSRRTDVDGDGGDSISHEARSDGTDSVLASSSDEDERDRTRNRSPLDKLIKQCDFKDSPTTLPPPAIPSATLPPAAPTSALPVVPIIVPPVSTDPISIPAPSEPPLPPSTTQPAPPPTEPAVPSQAPPPEETSTELPSPPPVSVPSDPGARPPVPTTSVEPPVALPSSDLPTSPPVVDTTLPPSLVPSPTSSALSTTSPPSPPVGPPSPPVIPPSGESPGGTGPGDIGSSPPLGPLLPLPGGGNLDDPLSQPLPVPVGEPGQADPLPPAPPVPSASPGSSGPSVSSPSPSPSPSAPPPAAGSGGGGSTSSSVSGVPAQTTPLGPLPSVPTAGASRLQAALLRSILATLAAGVIG